MNWARISESDRRRIRNWQVGMLILAILCELMLAADWYAFAAVITFVSETLGLDPAQAGFAQGSFAITYAIGMIVWSPISRTMSARQMLLLGLAGTAFGMLLQVFVQSFFQLVALRLLIGFFDAAIFIGNMKLIFGWFPQSKRGSMVGLILAAYSLAITLDFALGIPLSIAQGWRTFFGILAGATVVVAILDAVLAKNGPAEIGFDNFVWDGEPSREVHPMRAIIKSRWVFVAALALGGGTCAIAGTATWAIPSFIAFHKMPVENAPILGTLMGISQVIFLVIGGYIADKMVKSSMVKLGGVLALLVAIIFVLSSLQPLSYEALIGLSLISGISILSGGAVFSLVSEKYPESLAPAAIGYAEVMGVISTFIAPWAMGAAIKASGGSFTGAFLVFAGLEALLLIGLFILAREEASPLPSMQRV